MESGLSWVKRDCRRWRWSGKGECDPLGASGQVLYLIAALPSPQCISAWPQVQGPWMGDFPKAEPIGCHRCFVWRGQIPKGGGTQIPGAGDRERPHEGQDLGPQKASGTTTPTTPPFFPLAYLILHLFPSLCVCFTFLSPSNLPVSPSLIHGRKWPPRVASKSWIALTCTDYYLFIPLFMQQVFIEHLLYIPGPVLDVGDRSVNKIVKHS